MRHSHIELADLELLLRSPDDRGAAQQVRVA